MKYLHIIPPSKRMMYGYLSMIEHYFDENDHRYLIASELVGDDSALLLFKNVINFPDLGKGKIRKFLRIRKEFAQADRIVFHSFPTDKKWLLVSFLLRKYLSKAVWIMWGIDLYNYKSSAPGLLGKIEDYMGITCRKCMRYPVAIAETDIEVYNKTFGSYPVVFAPYGFVNERFLQMDTYMELRGKEIAEYNNQLARGETEPFDAITYSWNSTAKYHEGTVLPFDGRVRIQIGHNGFRFNNHVHTLRLLENIMNSPESKRLELVLPISYGNNPISNNVSYVRALRNYAEMKYPFNVSFLTKIMPANEYTRFLSTVDIAIFNAERQNGLGNILQLLYMGKKVYMSPNNPLFPYLTSKGFEIHDVNELEHISIEELLAPVKTSYPNPWIQNAFGMESTAKLWRNVFNYVEDNIDYSTVMKENVRILQHD